MAPGGLAVADAVALPVPVLHPAAAASMAIAAIPAAAARSREAGPSGVGGKSR